MLIQFPTQSEHHSSSKNIASKPDSQPGNLQAIFDSSIPSSPHIQPDIKFPRFFSLKSLSHLFLFLCHYHSPHHRLLPKLCLLQFFLPSLQPINPCSLISLKYSTVCTLCHIFAQEPIIRSILSFRKELLESIDAQLQPEEVLI